jgi:hypothetical protein
MIAARLRRAPNPSGLLQAVRDMINDRNWREGAILPSDAHVRFWAAAIVTATTEMRRKAAYGLVASVSPLWVKTDVQKRVTAPLPLPLHRQPPHEWLKLHRARLVAIEDCLDEIRREQRQA